MFERFKAMDQQTKIILILAGIIGILLFGTVTSGIRQAGWNEGFLAGLLTHTSGNAGETARAVAPYAGAHGVYSHHGWGGHPFGFIGGFFRFLFFGFLLMMFFKFLGFWRWRMHGGPPWHHHQHGPWRHQGPWGNQQGQPQAEQGRQSDPSPTPPEGHTPQPTSWVKV